jgi:hypothetical protein
MGGGGGAFIAVSCAISGSQPSSNAAVAAEWMARFFSVCLIVLLLPA